MSTWMKMLEESLAGRVPPPPIAKTIGFTMQAVERGKVTVAFEADPERHANPMGTLHGGVICDVADAAMGMAIASTLEDGESFTTIELKANYFKPVWKARLEAIGTVVRRTRAICYLECELFDEKRSLVAKVSSTCMVLRGEMAEGR